MVLGISNTFETYCKFHSQNCYYVVIWDTPQIAEKAPLAKKYEKLLNKNKKKVLYCGAKPSGEVGNITYISSVPMEMISDLMSRCDVLAAPRRSGTNTPMKVYTYMASNKPIVE